MRSKSLFLATTAVAVVAAIGPAQSGDLYVSVIGGANWQPGNSGSGTFIACCAQDSQVSFTSDPETGFTIGGAIGAHLDKWAQGLRTELEVSYRRNSLGGQHHVHLTVTDGSATGPFEGHTSNFSVLANVWYDIDMGWKAVPYVGGGAGWTKAKRQAAAPVTTETIGDNPTIWDQDNEDVNGFSYQLGAGVNYPVASGIDLGIGYRYFRGPSFDPIFVGKNHHLAVPFDNENHAVQVNLTVGIN